MHSQYPDMGENLYAAFGFKFSNNQRMCKYSDNTDDCAGICQ